MILNVLLLIVHVAVCLMLILVVLLQTGKRADLAGAFGGGGSQTAFGARGAATFLSKATTVAATVFMITSLALAYRLGQSTEATVVGDTAPVEAPAPAEPAPLPVVPGELPAPQGETAPPETGLPATTDVPGTPAPTEGGSEDEQGEQPQP
jgi:preprotein translocase subunit SecG